MDLLEGKMAETSSSKDTSTKLQQIAKLAREAPDMAITTLAHHINVEFLHEAYRRTRKDGAAGVDGRTAAEYAENLEENLQSLLDRAKSGTYRAPPVRRVHIPKGDGSKTRPIGIPTFEDKILQRAVAMVLVALYEQDFRDLSYGFRPGRSAHQALAHLWKGLMEMHGGWVLEVDIERFFDELDHAHLRAFLRQRVRDGVLLRLIGKWLKAGVLEEGKRWFPETGSPQGGVVSPILANVYLDAVFDQWFEDVARPRLRGHALAIRFADDIVMVFSREDDARRIMEALPKRFGRFGLTLHPEKTRLIEYRQPRGGERPALKRGQPRSFDFLGFTHFWARTRKGTWVVRRKTATDRLRRAIRRIWDWCRDHRHSPVAEQHEQLSRRLQGHYGYFGITGNLFALGRFWEAAKRAWRRWLHRRSQRARMWWWKFNRLLERYSLPPPRVVHSIYHRAAKP